MGLWWVGLGCPPAALSHPSWEQRSWGCRSRQGYSLSVSTTGTTVLAWGRFNLVVRNKTKSKLTFSPPSQAQLLSCIVCLMPLRNCAVPCGGLCGSGWNWLCLARGRPRGCPSVPPTSTPQAPVPNTRLMSSCNFPIWCLFILQPL